MVLGFNLISNADMGPKPEIELHLKNMPTTNYTVDLFVNNEYVNFSDKMNCSSDRRYNR